MAKKQPADVRNIDQLAKLFGLPDWDEVDERNVDYRFEAGSYAEREAREDGATEEEAEEAGLKAEQEAQDEVYRNWHSGVEAAAEDLFNAHGLALIGRGKAEPWYYEYKIAPERSWKDAAGKIMDTINGVGYFYFNSLREFLDSGPYTARQAVLEHLGYISDYPEVYGSSSARSIYERAWR
jgi:hypothetical protein